MQRSPADALGLADLLPGTGGQYAAAPANCREISAFAVRPQESQQANGSRELAFARIRHACRTQASVCTRISPPMSKSRAAGVTMVCFAM